MVEEQRSSLQFHVSSSKWSGTVVSLRFNQYFLLNCPVLYFVSKCYLCGTLCTSASLAHDFGLFQTNLNSTQTFILQFFTLSTKRAVL
jgi:hypothetical protein